MKSDTFTRRSFFFGCGGMLAFTAVCIPPARSLLSQTDTVIRNSPSVQRSPASMTAFVDVAVVPMDSERVLQRQTVLIEQGRIMAIGPVEQVAVPAGATRIDGRGKFLMPGLADMHTHLDMILNNTTSGERELFAWLSYGVTTIRNMDMSPGMHQERSLRLRARVASGEIPGPRIYVAAPGLPVKPTDAAQLVATYKATGYDFIKIYDSDINRADFDSFAAAARHVGLPLAGHVPLHVGLMGALEAPYASLEHLDGYLQYLASSNPTSSDSSSLKQPPEKRIDTTKMLEIFAATRRAGVWVCPTLYTREASAAYHGNDFIAKTIAAHYSPTVGISRRLVKAMQDSGVGLLLGADAPTAGLLKPGISLHQELEALVHAGLTPYQALTTGTRNVAIFFGTLNESGTVAVGKRADLLLLDGNPLTDVRHTEQPVGVMVGGHWFTRTELDRQVATFQLVTPSWPMSNGPIYDKSSSPSNVP